MTYRSTVRGDEAARLAGVHDGVLQLQGPQLAESDGAACRQCRSDGARNGAVK